jgi:hypothetical protein
VLSGDNEGEIFFRNTITCGNELILTRSRSKTGVHQAIARTRKKRDDGGDGLNDAGALAKAMLEFLFQKMSMFSHQLVMGFWRQMNSKLHITLKLSKRQ